MKNSFEEKMKSLEEIVKSLENEELNLDDSISQFEKGIELSNECNKILEEAEKKITILVNKEGKLEEEKFESN